MDKNNNTNLLPTGSSGSIDSTKLTSFYDDNENNIREVYNEMVAANWDLNIPNTNPTYLAEFPPTNGTPRHLFVSINPYFHIYLIAKEITTFLLTTTQIQYLCRIPHWDFEWRGYYNATI